MRPVLEPSAAPAASETTSITALPPEVRRFGYVPSIDGLLPGDLLLFSPAHPDFVGKRIAQAQLLSGLHPDHAIWTHAAVFLHDDVMVEAIPLRGVIRSSLYTRIPSHRILVRRDLKLNDHERYLIALRALGTIGLRYSHFGALLFGFDLVRGFWDERALAGSRQVVICSQVYVDAFLNTTKRQLAGCRADVATAPGYLSATPDLVDVALGWKKLV